MTQLLKTRKLLLEIETQLAQGKTLDAIQAELETEKGYTRRHASRIMRMLYTRFEIEAGRSRREAQRALIRRAAWATYSRAMAREAMSLDKDGGEHFYDSPDGGAAVRALELLCRLDGLLEQPAVAPNSGFGDDALRVLHLHYHGGPPVELPAIEAEATVVGKGGNGHSNGSNGHG